MAAHSELRVADLLLLLRQILEENWPTLRCERVVVVCRRRGRREEKETFRLPFPRRKPEPTEARPPTSLRPMALAVLDALADGGTIPPKALAARAGYPCNSDFRSVLTEMVRDGLLERLPEGLRAKKPGT